MYPCRSDMSFGMYVSSPETNVRRVAKLYVPRFSWVKAMVRTLVYNCMSLFLTLFGVSSAQRYVCEDRLTPNRCANSLSLTVTMLNEGHSIRSVLHYRPHSLTSFMSLLWALTSVARSRLFLLVSWLGYWSVICTPRGWAHALPHPLSVRTRLCI